MEIFDIQDQKASEVYMQTNQIHVGLQFNRISNEL